MPETTPKMGLAAWDQPLDFYNYHQLSNNWNIVDFHDHTPQRGVQIPYGGLAPGAVGNVNLASEVSVVPTGGVILWTMASAPSNFLVCDGSAVLKSSYMALWGVIGTTYNTTVPPAIGYFNVPLINFSIGSVYGALTWVIKT